MPTGTRSRIYRANASRVTDVIRSWVMYVIDLQGGGRFLASPMAGHTAGGSSYLPAGQLPAWGQGIVLVARQLAG